MNKTAYERPTMNAKQVEELRASLIRYPGESECGLSCAAVISLLDVLADRERFKAWVHDYLDTHAVPHHPPGTHGASGCRIGDRMDWLMGQLAEAKAERDAERAEDLALFQRHDCDWGCGCGKCHCAAGPPCLRCRARKLAESEGQLARSLATAVVERDTARAERDGLRAAVGPMLEDAKATIELLANCNWPDDRPCLLGVVRKMTLGQLHAAVAAFDGAGAGRANDQFKGESENV